MAHEHLSWLAVTEGPWSEAVKKLEKQVNLLLETKLLQLLEFSQLNQSGVLRNGVALGKIPEFLSWDEESQRISTPAKVHFGGSHHFQIQFL